ncbi:hypothetical protein JG687_00016097 [Phytophthora cactorum]|uniref:Uncharacterized protein n=1 Tax=Phytophthora cactorum TaxID=29920 RepID=A0A8T1TRY6_9STRA|nr:hypothetical protein PC121_g20241 [Phytophthora cactorum]KAG4042136.1 hypothetical protein PC123_g22365 [Phytophthora cactorum]KAG6947430.1 hypothetical protein JG687_00016097 [Phytophthora cactorum]
MGIETWDYNNFLQRFEGVRSDRRLTWMGGQPGRISAGAKTFTGISSMLELTDALDVRNPKTEHQLSLRALPRVLHDITFHRPPKPHLVGTRGVWQTLRNSSKVVQCESQEAGRPGYSHFTFSNATYAAGGSDKKASPAPSDSEEKKPRRADGTATGDHEADDEEKLAPKIPKAERVSPPPEPKPEKTLNRGTLKKEAAPSSLTESERAAPRRKRFFPPKRPPRAPASSEMGRSACPREQTTESA